MPFLLVAGVASGIDCWQSFAPRTCLTHSSLITSFSHTCKLRRTLELTSYIDARTHATFAIMRFSWLLEKTSILTSVFGTQQLEDGAADSSVKQVAIIGEWTDERSGDALEPTRAAQTVKGEQRW